MTGSLSTLRLLGAVVSVAGILADNMFDKCDPDYECKWATRSTSHAYFEFDFSALCKGRDGEVNDTNGRGYKFNVCGLTQAECNPPGYTSSYRYGSAIQFFGTRPPCNTSDPATMTCKDINGNPACCTEDCEVLGVGTPMWSVVNPVNPATGGVRITYSGVDPSYNDPFPLCPYDPVRQGHFRDISFELHCDPGIPASEYVVIGQAQEVTPCNYTITLRTKAACGCSPWCQGKTCGKDGCGGYCSGATLQGECPFLETCLSNGTCCRPDCTNRDCGSDGCGGSCGTCGEDEVCSSGLMLCVPARAYEPSAAIKYAVDSGGLAGAYFGGVLATLAIGAIGYFFANNGMARINAWRYGGTGADATRARQSLLYTSGAGAAGSNASGTGTGSGATAATISGSSGGGLASSGSGGYGSYGT